MMPNPRCDPGLQWELAVSIPRRADLKLLSWNGSFREREKRGRNFYK
jgi:hypothetical protein